MNRSFLLVILFASLISSSLDKRKGICYLRILGLTINGQIRLKETASARLTETSHAEEKTKDLYPSYQKVVKTHDQGK